MTTAERINSVANYIHQLRVEEVTRYLRNLEHLAANAPAEFRPMWEARLAGAESVWATMTAPLEDLLPEE